MGMTALHLMVIERTVVKLIEAETDEGGDILEELTDRDVKGIYEQLSHEDKKRFRQFREIPPPVLWCVRRTPAFLPYGQAGRE